MKTVKTLLLGTAAGFAAFTGAQAADLPMAEPVEYVKVCSTYGEGFFYIPGTDTCLQISGYVRFDSVFNANGDDGDDDGFLGGDDSNDFLTNARGTIAVDARSETEWGTLRSYIEYEGNTGSIEADVYDDAGNSIALEAAFVQFAGFTAGKASSFYDFVNAATVADFFSAETVNTFAYTASFGSGFAATIGIEDKYFRALPRDVDLDDGSSDLDQVWPNVIAAIRVDQAWGSAQISAAVQDNEGDTFEGTEDSVGWAVQAGVKLNAGFLSEGSYVWAQGAYSEGALSYAGAEDVFGNLIDLSVFVPDQSFFGGENNTMWQVGGGVTFQATKTVAFNGAATLSNVEFAGGGEFDFILAEANVFWTPVKNLDLGLAVIYGTIDGDIAAFDEDGDTVDADDLSVVARVQRSF
ncbi:porin [Terrihabitans rhizophilus]|uniref:Porin n=1 Tax=Terrihabitans rhizophilus TaxID=3092662 RepID=A0ABU4RP69_9HYPH|nr:porin [Terrihabitans sp. PJ23]MDX6806644.1 porin [Terrihabitans sp. PJ23]